MGKARVRWRDRDFERQLAAALERRADGVGEMVAEDMRSRAPRSSSTGHLPGGGHAADEIHHEVTTIPGGIRVSAGAPPDAFYLAFAEDGTSRQAATPWARPAVFGNKVGIIRKLEQG